MEMKNYFNLEHCLSQVLKKVKFEAVEEQPENIDLRFLRRIFLSDTYNGEDAPTDGIRYEAIIYGNQIVCDWSKRYHDCYGMGSKGEGAGVYFTMYEVSQVYLRILRIARCKYFREELPAVDNEGRAADLIYISKEILEILQKHPQFKEMIRDFGLELVPVLETNDFRITVSKFHE